MLKKLLSLINPKSWVEGVLFKKVFQKGIKGAVGVIIGFAGSPYFSDSVAPILNKILTSFNIVLTHGEVETGLTVLIAGLFSSAWNWLAHGPLKDMNLPDVK